MSASSNINKGVILTEEKSLSQETQNANTETTTSTTTTTTSTTTTATKVATTNLVISPVVESPSTPKHIPQFFTIQQNGDGSGSGMGTYQEEVPMSARTQKIDHNLSMLMTLNNTITNKETEDVDSHYKEKLRKLVSFFNTNEENGKEKVDTIAKPIFQKCILNKEPILELSNLDMGEVPSCLLEYEKQEGFIIRLNLKGNKLSTLPSWFSRVFKSIRQLDLSNNMLTTLSGDALLHFKNVEEINLTNNKFEFFPECLLILPKLKRLRISHNILVNIPSDITHLRFLEELDVSSNQLMTLPEEMALLKSIKKLNIRNNPFLESEMATVKKLISQFGGSILSGVDFLLDTSESSLKNGRFRSMGNIKSSSTDSVRSEENEDFSPVNNTEYSPDAVSISVAQDEKYTSSQSSDHPKEGEIESDAEEMEEIEVEEEVEEEVGSSDAVNNGTVQNTGNQKEHQDTENNNNNNNNNNTLANDNVKNQINEDQKETSQHGEKSPNVADPLTFVKVILKDSFLRSSFKKFLTSEMTETKKYLDFWDQVHIKYLSFDNEEKKSEYGYKIYYIYLRDGAKNKLDIDPEHLNKLDVSMADYLELKKPLSSDVFQEAIMDIQKALVDASIAYRNSPAFALISLKTQLVLDELEEKQTPSSQNHFSANERQSTRSCAHVDISTTAKKVIKKKKVVKKVPVKAKKKETTVNVREQLFEKKKEEERQRIKKLTTERYHALLEILESEKKYVDFLNVLWNVYYLPLSKNDDNKSVNGILGKLMKNKPTKLSTIPEDQRKKMFPPNLSDIIDLNRQLLKELEKRFSLYNSVGSQTPETIFFSIIGDIFCNFAPKFKIYANYAVAYEESMIVIRKCKEKYPVFDTWLQTKKLSGESKGYDLGSLLLMPIQRVPRYSLLLKALLQKTEVDHPDYNQLINACELIDEYATYQNQKIKETNNQNKINRLTKSLKLEGLSNEFKFIYEGDIKYYKTPEVIKSAKAYLFNDLLVFQHTKGSGLFQRKTCDQFSMKNAYISGGGSNTITLVIDTNQKIDFLFDSNDNLVTWMYYLSEVCSGNERNKKKKPNHSRSTSDGWFSPLEKAIRRKSLKDLGEFCKGLGSKLANTSVTSLRKSGKF